MLALIKSSTCLNNKANEIQHYIETAFNCIELQSKFNFKSKFAHEDDIYPLIYTVSIKENNIVFKAFCFDFDESKTENILDATNLWYKDDVFVIAPLPLVCNDEKELSAHLTKRTHSYIWLLDSKVKEKYKKKINLLGFGHVMEISINLGILPKNISTTVFDVVGIDKVNPNLIPSFLKQPQ